MAKRTLRAQEGGGKAPKRHSNEDFRDFLQVNLPENKTLLRRTQRKFIQAQLSQPTNLKMKKFLDTTGLSRAAITKFSCQTVCRETGMAERGDPTCYLQSWEAVP